VVIGALGWIIVGLIAWLVVAAVVGVLIGRMIRLRDRQVPHGDPSPFPGLPVRPTEPGRAQDHPPRVGGHDRPRRS
jgi:hypothetical protein